MQFPERQNISNTLLDQWDKDGKHQAVEVLQQSQKSYLDAHGKGHVDANHKDKLLFKQCLHELCWGCIDPTAPNPLKQEKAKPEKGKESKPEPKSFVSSIAQLLNAHVLANVTPAAGQIVSQAALVDVFWIIWHEIDDLPKGNSDDQKKVDKIRDDFVALVRECAWKPAVKVLLQERLQGDLVVRLKLMNLKTSKEDPTEEKAFNRLHLRQRTDKWYRQRKFNLLREEPEGYSKIITELDSCFCNSVLQTQGTVSSIDQTVTMIQSYIGYFQLDPNRVIDVVLECYERHIASTANHNDFYRIIDLFNQASVCQILGFKFQSFRKSADAPRALFALAAVLLQGNRIELNALWPHLSPADDQLQTSREKAVQSQNERARKLMTASFSVSEGDDDADGDDSVSKKSTTSNVLAMAAPLTAEFGAGRGGASMDLDRPRETTAPVKKPEKKDDSKDKKSDKDKEKQNQKLELLVELLNRDIWTQAEVILTRLGPILPASRQDIAQALCRLADKRIEPFYSRVAAPFRVLKGRQDSTVSDATQSKPAVSRNDRKSAEVKREEKPDSVFQGFYATMSPILKHLSIYLKADPLLFCKIARVVKHIVANSKTGHEINSITGNGPDDVQLSPDIEALVGNVMLPAFALGQANVGVSTELWSILSLLPYQTRFRLYGFWKKDLYEKHPEMLLKKAKTLSKTKYFKKRIAAAANQIKESGRSLVKFSLNNPLIVFESILEHLQSYENMITPLVDILKYMTPLCMDVVAFLVLDQLSSSRDKLKDDGMNEAHWFQSLASFAGHFYKKYPDVELGALLQFIVNQLKDEHSLDLLILKELVSHMAGVESIEELSDVQLRGQAGGKVLQQETISFRATKSRKRPAACLMEAMMKRRLVFPLFVLVAQAKQSVVFHTDGGGASVKLVAELADKCQNVLTQLVDFLSGNMAEQDYGHCFPSLKDLCTRYFLPTDVAFLAVRSVLSMPHIFGQASVDVSQLVTPTPAPKPPAVVHTFAVTNPGGASNSGGQQAPNAAAAAGAGAAATVSSSTISTLEGDEIVVQATGAPVRTDLIDDFDDDDDDPDSRENREKEQREREERLKKDNEKSDDMIDDSERDVANMDQGKNADETESSAFKSELDDEKEKDDKAEKGEKDKDEREREDKDDKDDKDDDEPTSKPAELDVSLMDTEDELKKADSVPPTPVSDAERAALEVLERKRLETKSREARSFDGPLKDTCRGLLPPDTWKSLSPELFASFWSLRTYDLIYPQDVYATQIKKYRTSIAVIDALPAAQADEKKKKEKERCAKLILKLKQESLLQDTNYKSVFAALKAKKNSLLDGVELTAEAAATKEAYAELLDQTATNFVEYCILPRCLSTALDALYCSKFIEVLLEIDLPKMSAVVLFDRILKSLPGVTSSATNNEAGRFGRFLHDILSILNVWVTNKKVYEEKYENKAMFEITTSEGRGVFTHAHLQQAARKWHKGIARSFVSTLESPQDAMELNNALLILSRIAGVFPKAKSTGALLEKSVARLAQDPKSKGSSLKVLASRTLSTLTKYKKTWLDDEKYYFAIPPEKPKIVASTEKDSKEEAKESDKGADAKKLGAIRTDKKPASLKPDNSSGDSKKPEPATLGGNPGSGTAPVKRTSSTVPAPGNSGKPDRPNPPDTKADANGAKPTAKPSSVKAKESAALVKPDPKDSRDKDSAPKISTKFPVKPKPTDKPAERPEKPDDSMAAPKAKSIKRDDREDSQPEKPDSRKRKAGDDKDEVVKKPREDPKEEDRDRDRRRTVSGLDDADGLARSRSGSAQRDDRKKKDGQHKADDEANKLRPKEVPREGDKDKDAKNSRLIRKDKEKETDKDKDRKDKEKEKDKDNKDKDNKDKDKKGKRSRSASRSHSREKGAEKAKEDKKEPEKKPLKRDDDSADAGKQRRKITRPSAATSAVNSPEAPVKKDKPLPEPEKPKDKDSKGKARSPKRHKK